MCRSALATLLGSLLLLPSCFLARSHTNEPLNVRAVRSLQPGETTAREVVERLGGPTEVVQLGRRSAYRYDAANLKRAGITLLILTLFNEDTRSDRLWVFFDENDVLSHYGVTFATHRAQYAMPWEDIHEESDRRADDAGREGLGDGP